MVSSCKQNKRISHIITELYESGNDVVGKAKIMDTPYGKIVKNLLDEGAKLGVSTRGMGSLTEKNGTKYVGDDFMLAAVDIVADPSAPSAFVDGIMEEYFHVKQFIKYRKAPHRTKRNCRNNNKNQ